MSESSTSLPNGYGAISNNNSSGISGNNNLQEQPMVAFMQLTGLSNDVSGIRAEVDVLKKENKQLKEKIQKCEDNQHKFLGAQKVLCKYIFLTEQ